MSNVTSISPKLRLKMFFCRYHVISISIRLIRESQFTTRLSVWHIPILAGSSTKNVSLCNGKSKLIQSMREYSRNITIIFQYVQSDSTSLIAVLLASITKTIDTDMLPKQNIDTFIQDRFQKKTNLKILLFSKHFFSKN